jgi:hypothetical protein
MAVSCCEAQAVHGDLAALAAFAVADQDRAAVQVKVACSFRASVSLMRSPARQSTMIRPRSRTASLSSQCVRPHVARDDAEVVAGRGSGRNVRLATVQL